MEQAFKAANITVPLEKRVWLWVKDHKLSTRRTLEKALQLDRMAISFALQNLVRRGMLETHQVAAPPGQAGRQRIAAFAVPAGMYEYELLPMPKRTKVAKAPKAPAKWKAEVKVPAHTAAPPEPAKRTLSGVDMENLQDAHKIYLELHKFFGPAATVGVRSDDGQVPRVCGGCGRCDEGTR